MHCTVSCKTLQAYNPTIQLCIYIAILCTKMHMGICDAYLLKLVTNHTSPSSLAEAIVVSHQFLNAVLGTDG